MSQPRIDRRTLLWVGTAGTLAALGLRSVLAHEGDDHHGTPPAATPGATPGATPSAGSHLIKMENDLAFHPAHLTLQVGDTVTWRNTGAIAHSSTCDPDESRNPEEHVQLPEGAEPWNSGLLDQGEAFAHTFEVAGEYTYFCIPHEQAGMIGHLTVEA